MGIDKHPQLWVLSSASSSVRQTSFDSALVPTACFEHWDSTWSDRQLLLGRTILHSSCRQQHTDAIQLLHVHWNNHPNRELPHHDRSLHQSAGQKWQADHQTPRQVEKSAAIIISAEQEQHVYNKVERDCKSYTIFRRCQYSLSSANILLFTVTLEKESVSRGNKLFKAASLPVRHERSPCKRQEKVTNSRNNAQPSARPLSQIRLRLALQHAGDWFCNTAHCMVAFMNPQV